MAITVTSAGIEIYDPIQYPDKIKIKSASVEINFSTFSDQYTVKQFGNFYLLKEVTTNIWRSQYDLDINPNYDTEIQTLIDTYSGLSAGVHKLTAQQIYDMCAASAGVLVMVFAEGIDSTLGISGDDLETNLAKIKTNTGKTIWSYDII